MSSGTSIIQEALQNIDSHSVVDPAIPESITLGMRRLNSWLQLLLSNDIDLGTTPLKVPGDELNEPLDARQAIIDNLSILLAPTFESEGRSIVSPTLMRNAKAGLIAIETLYLNHTIPDKVISSTTPLGAGNTRGTRRRVFVGPGATIPSTDA